MFELPPLQPVEQSPVWDYTVDVYGREFRIRLRHNTRLAAWYLDLWGGDGRVLRRGYKLVVGGIGWVNRRITRDPEYMYAQQTLAQSVEGDQEFGAINFFPMDLGNAGDSSTDPDYDSLGTRHILLASTLGEIVFSLVLEGGLDPESGLFNEPGIREVTQP